MKPNLLFKPKAGLPTFSMQWAALLLAGCLAVSSSSMAADTWSLPESSLSQTWQGVTWSKNGVDSPGQYPGTPGGSSSDLIVTSSNGVGTTGLLYMNGSHTLAGFEKRGTGTFSVRSYVSTSTTTPQEDLLTISGLLKVSDGTLNLRSRKTNQTLKVSAAAVEISGAGTLVLGDSDAPITGAAFDMTTIEEGGTLRIVRANNVNLGALTQGGTLNLSDYNSATPFSSTITATSLEGQGTITSGGNNLTLTLALIGSNASAVTFAGVIEDTSNASTATIGVQKSGTGVQIFSGGNTYSGGTVISGGVLAVTNTTGSGLGDGAVRVKDGGTLAGSGVVEINDSIRAEHGAVVAPGAGLGQTAVTLRLSGAKNGAAPILIMEEGAEFHFNLAFGDVSDRIEFLSYSEGDLVLDTLNGTAVNVTGVELGTYRLFSFNSLSSEEGEALAEHLRLGNGFSGFEESHFFYMDNAVHLAAVPEPSTLALLGAGLTGLAWLRRRRQID
jgi:autotransporter-associated beta strand protein